VSLHHQRQYAVRRGQVLECIYDAAVPEVVVDVVVDDVVSDGGVEGGRVEAVCEDQGTETRKVDGLEVCVFVRVVIAVTPRAVFRDGVLVDKGMEVVEQKVVDIGNGDVTRGALCPGGLEGFTEEGGVVG
jgi:hypothetical protein